MLHLEIIFFFKLEYKCLLSHRGTLVSVDHGNQAADHRTGLVAVGLHSIQIFLTRPS